MIFVFQGSLARLLFGPYDSPTSRESASGPDVPKGQGKLVLVQPEGVFGSSDVATVF